MKTTMSKPEPLDITVVADVKAERLIAHRPDCPQVRRARGAGAPLLTLYDCQEHPDVAGLVCHDCLDSGRE